MFNKVPYRLMLVVLLVSSFVVLIVLRVPSVFEPKWYGDEGIYAAIAHHLRSGGLLYKDAWGNKPPLLYLFYVFFDFCGVHNQVVARITNLIFSALTAVVLFFFVFKVTGKLVSATLAAVLVNLVLATPLIEANIANAENFFILFSCLGVFLLWLRKKSTLFFGGLLFSVAVLIKVPPLFEFLGAVLFFIVEAYIDRQYLGDFLKRYWLAVLGFVVPLLFTIFYFLVVGVLGQFIYSAFLFGFSYVQDPFVTMLIPSLLPNKLFLRMLLFGFLLGSISIMRLLNKLKPDVYFAFIWLITAFIGATLSSRAYPHYLIQVVTPAAFLFAVVFTSKFSLRSSALSLLIIFVLFNVFTGWGALDRVMPDNYYKLFLDRWTGRISYQEFNRSFDPSVLEVEEISVLLATRYPGVKEVFIYADIPWIYDLAGIISPVRFFSAYHVFWRDWSTEKTMLDLHRGMPRLIIIKETIEAPHVFKEFVHSYYVFSTSLGSYDFYLLAN